MREIRFVAYVHLRNRWIAKDTPSFIQPWSHGYSATTLECEGVTPGDEKVRRATVIAESADKKAIAAKSVAESAGHFYEYATSQMGVSGIGRQFCSAFNRFLRCCAVSLADRGGGPSTPQPCARLPQSPPRSFVQLKHKVLVVPIHISVPSQLGYTSDYCRPYPKGSLANLCV